MDEKKIITVELFMGVTLDIGIYFLWSGNA